MSPQYHLARRLLAGAFALTAIAAGVIGGSEGANAEPSPVYNGEIAFIREYPSTGDSLAHAIRPDGSDLHALRVSGLALAYSPDGTRIAWVSGQGINVLDLTTNENVLAVPGATPSFSLSWSADGATLAWAATDNAITLASVDGTNTRKILATDDGAEFNPVFIPGTSRLAYIRLSNGPREIWTVESDGTDARVLVPDANSAYFGLDVSPDGAKITYWSLYSVMVADIDGTNLHALTSGGIAKFSPDNEWLVFSRGGTSESAETTGLWLIRLDGTGLHQLTQGEDVFAVWQPRTTPLPELPTTTTTTTSTTSTSTTTSTTTPNQAPVPRFTKFAQVPGHYVVARGNTSSDPDGTITKYEWRWGDGTTPGTTAQAWHKYTNPGWYLIRLTVTDNRGATATRGVWYHVN